MVIFWVFSQFIGCASMYFSRDCALNFFHHYCSTFTVLIENNIVPPPQNLPKKNGWNEAPSAMLRTPPFKTLWNIKQQWGI